MERASAPWLVKTFDQLKNDEYAVGANDKVELDQTSATDGGTGGTTACPYRHDTMRV